jgi:hypothetical protein
MKRLTSIFIAIAVSTPTPTLFLADAEAGIASQNRACQKAYSEWKKRAGHKAFAITPSTGFGAQTCGAVWNASSKAIAEREALKQCGSGKLTPGSTCSIMESK